MISIFLFIFIRSFNLFCRKPVFIIKARLLKKCVP